MLHVQQQDWGVLCVAGRGARAAAAVQLLSGWRSVYVPGGGGAAVAACEWWRFGPGARCCFGVMLLCWVLLQARGCQGRDLLRGVVSV